jgi:hypothetical protein
MLEINRFQLFMHITLAEQFQVLNVFETLTLAS